jgi:hypothetical protein
MYGSGAQYSTDHQRDANARVVEGAGQVAALLKT